jgi:YVTN family beta-propeller protein
MPRLALAACAVLLWLLGSGARPGEAFVTFEAGQVRPLALSPDGTRLFAANTPDGRLEIFAVGAGGLTRTASVQVGLEPIAVAARSNTEVWVVNHLSDSVSIVDVGTSPPRVVRTLLVGDEPRDVVFAGPGGNRAFVTTAHRGQQRTHPSIGAVPGAGDPQLTTEGIGRADVWVFDAANLGATLGGTPLTILALFADTPRALAVSPDRSVVYAAAFQSGNQTMTIGEGLVCNGGAAVPPCSVGGFTMPGGLPAPNTNFQGIAGPEVGLIVKFDLPSGQWRDRLGRNWNNAVRFSLPDTDVFAIDANTSPPVEIGSFAHVGTVLMNMAVNPVSGKVYVSNTEARNEVRFEGPGTFGGSTVRGHLHEARVTVLDGANVLPRHLNKHIVYGTVPTPPDGTKEKSLAIPVDMAVSSNGQTLYVAAFGSSQVGIFGTAALEANTFVPNAADHITVSGGGPSGLALDEPRGRLYVLTRFDNGISVVNTATRLETAHLTLHNPEPATVVTGRPVLYDAVATSSNGEASCASCHIFGDFDSLAWDLGNPDDVLLNDPNPFKVGSAEPFHPMKGPMTTQSLRGMANHGPMHWRGDRTGGNDPGGDPLNESQAFKKFIVAFQGLIGRATPIADAEMQKFTDFILQVTYPPNPIRPLDNDLAGTPAGAGRNLFNGRVTDGAANCNGCHRLDPAAGFFGGDGFMSFEGETQLFKIPHLRNMYQKVGMFGLPQVPGIPAGNNGNTGPQVRGFGFLHDGGIDTLFRFHSAIVFSLSDQEQLDMEQFMLAFDTNLAPIVGQQTTLTGTNGATVGGRIDLLIQRAAAGECEVVVKGTLGGLSRGWRRLPAGTFRSDRAAEPLLTDAQLRAQAGTTGQERTYTCVPPGEGVRLGVDRDGDGFFDTDEVDAGSDPANPASIPGSPTTTTTTTVPGTTTTTTTLPGTTTTTTTAATTTTTTLPIAFTNVRSTTFSLRDDSVVPIDLRRRKVSFKSATRLDPPPNRIVPPAPGSSGDPTLHGALLVVYNAAGLTTDLTVVSLDPVGALPGEGWSRLGSGGSFNGWRYKGKNPSGPVSSVIVKADSITVRGGRANWGYTLNEVRQGRVALRLELGTSRWCAEIPARQSGNPPSTANNDHVDRFVGQLRAGAPAICPPLP